MRPNPECILASKAFAAMNSFWILDFEGIRSHEFIFDSDGWAYETESRMHSGFKGIHSQEFILHSGLRMHSHEFVYDAGIFVSNILK